MKNLVFLFLTMLFMISCGQEAKFHSVYEKGEVSEMPETLGENLDNSNCECSEEKERRIFICDYEYLDGKKQYVCREIDDSLCSLDTL